MFFNQSLVSRRLFALLVSSIVAVTIGAITASAQTTGFTYQGRLTDGPNPANGAYDMEFKLFDLATVGTGTQQGSTIQRLTISIANGSFTVQLDFGSCASCFNGANRFLEINVKPTTGLTYTTLAPRQQINSTPYALKSVNAATADGLSVACVNCVTSSQIASVNGSAVTGTIPVASVPAGSSNYIQNTTSEQASSNFNISGNGVIGGTLGIGTSTPSGLLHVRGASPVRILGDTTTLSGSEFVDFMARSSIFNSELGGMRIQRQLFSGDIDTLVFTAAGGSSASEKMRVSGNGNVGIGTTTPIARLAVRGNGTDVLVGNAGCGAPTAAIGFGTMSGCTDFALGANVSTGASAGTFINRPSGRSIHFRENNGPDQMTIAPDGNVGIGTTSPGFMLDVADRIRVRQGNTPSAGIWFNTNSLGDRAFVGMQDLVRVGFYGNAGADWGLTMDTTTGDLAQRRDSGGLVKAMAFVNPLDPGPNKILRCYNSSGSGSSTPPCGFSYFSNVLGVYEIGFGFKVDDRFISLTPFGGGIRAIAIRIISFFDANSLTLRVEYTDNNQLTGSAFWIIVY